jgi:hypothetical protein
MEGNAGIAGAAGGSAEALAMRDAAGITGEGITVNAEEESRLLPVETAKSLL